MSDARRRALERRWRETADPADEAAFLTERLRAGEVSAVQVELWAYCGSHGAALVMLQAGTPITPTQGLERWVAGLERWGRRPCAAAALAALPLVWPHLAEGVAGGAALHLRPWDARHLAELARLRVVAEGWLRAPTATAEAHVARERWRLSDQGLPPDLPPAVWRRESAGRVLRMALDTIVEESFAASAVSCLSTANDLISIAELTRAAREAVISLVP